MTPSALTRHPTSRITDRAYSMLELATRPHDGLENLYRRFGPVCTFGLGALRLVYLLGAEANRFVITHSDLFRWREAFESLAVVDGDTALIVSDGPDHERRRRLVAPAFTSRRIAAYTAMMRSTMDAAIDTWRPGQLLDLYAELRRVVRRSTIHVLFGERLAAEEAELGRLLQHALDVVGRPPPWQQLQRFGAPSWRRARSARATVAQRIRREMEDRRRVEHPDDPTDVLDVLLRTRDDEAGLAEVEIIDQVISLIAAGYETTSAAMGWATYRLLADPEVHQRAGDCLNRTAGERYLDGVVSETLRLHPPAVISGRKVARPFAFAGTHVPVGSMLLISPYVTHRLPELWTRPLAFEPERWDPTRPGFQRPGPHEYLPFGGGPHRCLGATFANTEMRILLEQLLRRTSLRLEHIDTHPVGLAAMRPRQGPIVRVVTVE